MPSEPPSELPKDPQVEAGPDEPEAEAAAEPAEPEPEAAEPEAAEPEAAEAPEPEAAEPEPAEAAVAELGSAAELPPPAAPEPVSPLKEWGAAVALIVLFALISAAFMSAFRG